MEFLKPKIGKAGSLLCMKISEKDGLIFLLGCLNPRFSSQIQQAKLNAGEVAVSTGRKQVNKKPQTLGNTSINYKSLKSVQTV